MEIPWRYDREEYETLLSLWDSYLFELIFYIYILMFS